MPSGGQQGFSCYSREQAVSIKFQKSYAQTHGRTRWGLVRSVNIYRAFIRYCEAAAVEYRTYDETGRLILHVDIHSLRRTFATDLIMNGTDPKTVQELLGHSTLTMTMNIYAKVRDTTKRQALARLSYGTGAGSPEHLINLEEKRKSRRQGVATTETMSQVQ
jgi:Phage integrase family